MFFFPPFVSSFPSILPKKKGISVTAGGGGGGGSPRGVGSPKVFKKYFLGGTGHFWTLSGVTLGPFWYHFGQVCTISCPFVSDLLRSFFGVFWWCFGSYNAKLSKTRQEKGKICKFLPKVGGNMQNRPQFCPFFRYKTLVLLKKKRSKSTFQHMKVSSKWVCVEASWVDFDCF